MRFLFLATLFYTAVHAAPPKAQVIAEPPTYLHVQVGQISMECVSFDSRTHKLQVVDQANGPESQFLDCKAAAQSCNAIAAINAGFFTPNGAPLGVVISNGKKSGANNPSSLGSAVWFDTGKFSAIVRRAKTSFTAKELIQAGPMLIENGESIQKLESQKVSARSFIAYDGAFRWAIIRTSPCSLADLSVTLKKATSPFVIRTAMNLDGGRSSEFYTSDAVINGGTFTRPLWNKPVRNYLVLLPK